MSRFATLFVVFLSTFSLALTEFDAVSGAEPALKLRRGDHIAVIGNTMADRLQHSGWLDTSSARPPPGTRPGLPQPRRPGR